MSVSVESGKDVGDVAGAAAEQDGQRGTGEMGNSNKQQAESAPQEALRPHAETAFAGELAALAAQDDRPARPGGTSPRGRWRPTSWAAPCRTAR